MGRLGFGMLTGFIGRIKGFFDSGIKKTVEQGSSALKSAATGSADNVEMFIKSNPEKFKNLDQDDIDLIKKQIMDVGDAGASALSTEASRNGWKTWLPVGLLGGGAIAAGQPALQGAFTAWNTAGNEAGNKSFFHVIFDWIARFMDNLGLSDKFPGARAWLGDRTKQNQGALANIKDSLTDNVITNNPNTSLAVGGLAATALVARKPILDAGKAVVNKFTGKAQATGGTAAGIKAGSSNSLWSKTKNIIIGKSKLGKIARVATVATGAGLYAVSEAEASPTSARTEFIDAATDVIPGADIVKDLARGDIDAAIEDGAGLAGGITGAFMAAGAATAAGATTGVWVGAAVGSFVPVAGNAVGAVAGTVVGGAIGLGGYILGDSVARGLSSLFNSKADDTAPAHVQSLQQPTTAPRYANVFPN